MFALGNADEPRHARLVQITERDTIDGRHLVGIGHELPRIIAPHDEWRDDEARTSRIVIEKAQHGPRTERQAGLLVKLPSDGGFRSFPDVDPTARQRPLTGMRS